MTTRTPALVLRPAVPDDAEGIVALLDEVAREGTLGVPRAPRRPAEERSALAMASASPYTVWIAEYGGEVAGHMLVVRGPAPYLGHVADVAVAVAGRIRRQGAGGRLLDAAIAWGGERGLDKLCASVLAGNAPALALFASRGFREEGRRKGQFRIGRVARDEIILARFLG